jgi:hypothetical protein
MTGTTWPPRCVPFEAGRGQNFDRDDADLTRLVVPLEEGMTSSDLVRYPRFYPGAFLLPGYFALIYSWATLFLVTLLSVGFIVGAIREVLPVAALAPALLTLDIGLRLYLGFRGGAMVRRKRDFSTQRECSRNWRYWLALGLFGNAMVVLSGVIAMKYGPVPSSSSLNPLTSMRTEAQTFEAMVYRRDIFAVSLWHANRLCSWSVIKGGADYQKLSPKERATVFQRWMGYAQRQINSSETKFATARGGVPWNQFQQAFNAQIQQDARDFGRTVPIGDNGKPVSLAEAVRFHDGRHYIDPLRIVHDSQSDFPVFIKAPAP